VDNPYEGGSVLPEDLPPPGRISKALVLFDHNLSVEDEVALDSPPVYQRDKDQQCSQD
jgi:hypothetical protein